MSITLLPEHEGYSLACLMLQICLSWHFSSALPGTLGRGRDKKETVREFKSERDLGERSSLTRRELFFFFLERQTEPRWVRTCALLAPLEGALCNFDVTYLFFTGIRGWSERAALFDRKYENQGLDIGSGLWETYGLMNWVEGLNVHREWEDYSVQDVCMHVIPEK